MPQTILYIDDDEHLIDEIGPMLRQADFAVTHARTPKEAMQCVRDASPTLVLAEVLLEGHDGYALVERLMAEAAPRPLPVIVLTRGDRTPELYGRGLELGVEDFLCKPATRAEILEAVLDCAQYANAEAPRTNTAPAAQPSFSGELDDELLPALLGRLHRAAASGVLSIRAGGRTGALELRNGAPLQVSLEQETESVAKYLLKTGRIDEQQYEMLLDHLMAKLAGPREILLGMGALGEAELRAATHEQAHGLVLAMCRWSSGTFAFEAGAKLDAANSLEISGRAEAIVLAGTKRIDRETLDPFLARRAHLYVCLATDRSDAFDNLGLAAEQRADALALTGERSLGEVLDRSHLDGPALYRLLATGLVDLDNAPMLVLDEELKPELPAEEPLEIDPEDELMGPDLSRSRLPRQRVVDDGTTEATIRHVEARLEARDDFALFEIDGDSSNTEVRAAYDRLRGCLATDRIPEELDELRSLARELLPKLDQAYARIKDADVRQAFADLNRRKGETSARSKPKPVEDEAATAERAREAESWFRTGEGHLAHDAYAEAIEAFGMAVHCDPSQGDYHAHLGYAMYRSNPDQEILRREALEHVAKGVKLSPDREKPLLFLGRIFRESGEAAQAAKVLRRALELSPDSPALVQEMCLIQGTSKRANRGLFARLRGR